MLTWEHVEKIQKFPPCALEDMSFRIHNNPFFGPSKNRAAALHNVPFVWKNVQNGGASLDSFFKASWLYAWKNFKSFGIVQHIGKK